jgi:3'-5' exoribonuclease
MAYLKDIIEAGGAFDGPLLVKTCEKGVASNGSFYYNLTLQDITGSINGKKWSVEVGDDLVLAPGKVVRFTGTIIKYRNQPQFKIESVASMPEGSYDVGDFYLSCPISDEELYKDLDEMIEKIKDEDLKKLTKEAIKENEDKYMTYPAAVSVHHAYRCGIVYHSLSIAKDALAIGERYPYLNMDYLLCGALLHDIGKTREMSGVIASNYTFEGNLLGHISIGAQMVEEVGEKIGTPKDKLTVVVHMILSHHGQPDFGSPVVPQTPEAFVLHMLDDLDSKMYILETALRDVKVGEFSQRLPFLDNKAFLKTK